MRLGSLGDGLGGYAEVVPNDLAPELPAGLSVRLCQSRSRLLAVVLNPLSEVGVLLLAAPMVEILGWQLGSVSNGICGLACR